MVSAGMASRPLPHSRRGPPGALGDGRRGRGGHDRSLPQHVRATYQTSVPGRRRPPPRRGPGLRHVGPGPRRSGVEASHRWALCPSRGAGETTPRKPPVRRQKGGPPGAHAGAARRACGGDSPGSCHPCAAPEHWSTATCAMPSVAGMGTLRQPPPGDCFAALSFAICQVDEHGDLKLRRGEDRGTTPPWGRPTCPPTISWGISST